MAKENKKSAQSGGLPEQGALVSSEDLKQCQDCGDCKFRCIEGCC